jgi:hypothetical protein
MSPTKPLLLTVMERVEWVLRNIVAGDTYNYTASERKVVRGLRAFTEAVGYPFDMVYLGTDHKPIEYQPDHRVFRYPTVLVASYVDEEMGEPVTKLLKHLADVQLALETDLRSTDQGSLGALIGWGHLGSVATDEGELSLEGGAGFRQSLDLCLVGDWGEL